MIICNGINKLKVSREGYLKSLLPKQKACHNKKHLCVCMLQLKLNQKYQSFLSYTGFSWVGKESACNAGDLTLNPGLGRCPGEGYPLWYSGLENSMDAQSMGSQSQTGLNHFHVRFLKVHRLLSIFSHIYQNHSDNALKCI